MSSIIRAAGPQRSNKVPARDMARLYRSGRIQLAQRYTSIPMNHESLQRRSNLTRRAQIVVLVLSMAAWACFSSAVPTQPSAGEVATIVAGTLRALTPPAGPTLGAISAPPTAALPTLILPASPQPAGTRIQFATGATYSVTTGTLQTGESRVFVLKAVQNQPMIAMANSLNNDITLLIKAQTGATLLNAAQNTSSWQGILPATQDYYVTVIGGNAPENFTLTIEVPARIQFAPGSVSATRSGQTANGYIVSFVLYAEAGQQMTLKLSDTGGKGALSIYGFSDGQPYLRSVVEATDFSFTLPTTQDYIVEVVPQAGQVVNYALKVTVR